MRRTIVLALLLLLPRPASAQGLLRTLAVATFASQALDLHSTAVLEAHGGGEGNPVLKPLRPAARIAVKLSLTAAVVTTAFRARRQHPKLAIVVLAASSGFTAAAAWHNYRIVRRP